MSIERFVKAQEKTYANALAELKAGAKKTHWMWWIFPQQRGLGTSDRAILYAIADEAEAVAYLQHPVLGQRYRECVRVVHQQICVKRVAPLKLMGEEIDVMKLKSSIKLFRAVMDKVADKECVEMMDAIQGAS
jgi:uncharacterized protein (DUF1810 family)